MMGRRYSEGLHQALEAKENLKIRKESKTLATITLQNYFRMYEKLSGMTGTAATEAEEFYKIYGLEVVVIPTNEPMIRLDHPDFVYKTETAKYRAVVNEIIEKHEKGQPVLVGTTSIEKNELLHEFLKKKGIPHNLLNAKNHEKEAQIIAQAGEIGRVTVATNIAGRGVDIELGGAGPKKYEGEKWTPELTKAWQENHNKVVELGGLHVIGTERHESRRIDNQLRGRSGRQGDPGSSRFFVSLRDDIMRIFGGEAVANIMDRLKMDENIPIEHSMVSRSLESAQKRVEGHNFDIRKHLVEYDDVMNIQRELVYKMRRLILEALEKTEEIDKKDLDFKNWMIEKLLPFNEKIEKDWEEKEASIRNRELFFKIVQQVTLQTIDVLWMEHIDTMSNLKEGIGLRGYGQRDPLTEYKKEGRLLFDRLVGEIFSTVAERILKVEVQIKQPMSAVPQRLAFTHPTAGPASADKAQTVKPQTVRKGKKIGRNDPCWCNSGKKYKKCHYPQPEP